MAYINPILHGWNPDPSVCRRGDEFFMVTSTFMYFPGVPIYRSQDLVHWELVGHALTRKNQLDFSIPERRNEIFAPTLRYYEGRFYLITTDVGGIGNFFVTAENPVGPWSDPIRVDVGLFDPSLLFDDDGRVYYTRRGKTGIVQAEIDLSTGKLTTPLREIGRGFVSEDAEGPHLYKIRGRYYLLTAEGGSRYGHMVAIGRSSNPWGPFEPCPHNPILTQRGRTFSPIRDTGHGELVEDRDGRWWLFFLGTRNWTYSSFAHLGRETHLLPVEWTVGDWPFLEEGGRAFPLVGGNGVGILGPELINDELHEEYDDWSSATLDCRWITVRGGVEGALRWGPSIEDRAVGLEIDCRQDAGLDGLRPALLARRLTAFGFEAEVQVELKASESGAVLEAGICLYLDECHHYEAAIRLSSTGTITVVLKKQIEDMSTESPTEELPGSITSIRLGIVGTDEEFVFRFALPGEQAWRNLGTGTSKLLWPELASQWTGTVIGVYARAYSAREPQATVGSARFRSWRYRETESHWWKIDGTIPQRLVEG